MRRLTRNFLLGLVAIVVVLLALGAVPGLLRSGNPYYLTATPVTTAGEGGSDAVETPYNASDLAPDRFRYATAALADATAEQPGRSDPYWRGPVGLKGAFTHSPFDELASIRGRAPNATDGDAVVVRREETTFRLAVVREDDP